MHSCILCNTEYVFSESVGLLQCRIHPLSYNITAKGQRYGLNHYDCCGASFSEWDSTHYEFSNPKGCHAIDHVSSYEELETIKKSPFLCIEQANSINKNLLQLIEKSSRSKKQYLIPVLNQETLEYDYYFKLPFDNIYIIDLSKEHSKLLNNMIESSKYSLKKTSHLSTALYYSSEYDNQDKSASDYSSFQKFIPFYIIRRMDFKVNLEKMKEIQADFKCIY